MHNLSHEYSRISRTPMFEGHDIANENTNGTIGFALLVVTAEKDLVLVLLLVLLLATCIATHKDICLFLKTSSLRHDYSISTQAGTKLF